MAKKAEIKVNMDGFEKAFRNVELEVRRKASSGMAKAIIKEMLDLISKGISPIHGHGRFPPYKAQAEANQLRKDIGKLSKQKRGVMSTIFSKRRNRLTNDILSKKFRLIDIEEQTGSSRFGDYPYNMRDKFPNKKPRPVNLYLSGKFLSNLTYIVSLGEKPGAIIGFFDKESIDKERGHREMANGQGFRPIIPQGKEQFSRAVLMEAANFLKQVVRDYYKKAFK